MDALSFAKQMEIEGKDHYLKLADETPVQAFKGFFNFLAKEEEAHIAVFDALLKEAQPNAIERSTVGASAKSVFAQLAGSFVMPRTDYDFESVYASALEMEQKSIAYYRDLLEKNEAPKAAGVLRAIIEQEKQHARLLEGLIEFVKQPARWLENAEFNHLEDY